MPHKKTIEKAVQKVVENLNALDGLASNEKQQVVVRFNEAIHRFFPPAERITENPGLLSQLRVEMAVIQMISSLKHFDGLSFEQQVEALAELKEVLGMIDH